MLPLGAAPADRAPPARPSPLCSPQTPVPPAGCWPVPKLRQHTMPWDPSLLSPAPWPPGHRGQALTLPKPVPGPGRQRGAGGRPQVQARASSFRRGLRAPGHRPAPDLLWGRCPSSDWPVPSSPTSTRKAEKGWTATAWAEGSAGEGPPRPPTEPPWAEPLSWVLIRPVDVGRLPGFCASSALAIAGASHRGQRGGGEDKAGPQAGSRQEPGADRALAKRNHQDPQDRAWSRGPTCPLNDPVA